MCYTLNDINDICMKEDRIHVACAVRGVNVAFGAIYRGGRQRKASGFFKGRGYTAWTKPPVAVIDFNKILKYIRKYRGCWYKDKKVEKERGRKNFLFTSLLRACTVI